MLAISTAARSLGSQARTARSAAQDGVGGGRTAHGPSLRGRALARSCNIVRRRVPVNQVPRQKQNAQLTKAWCQRIAVAKRTWEVGPAQLILDPLIALLGPVPNLVDPGDVGQVRRRMDAGGLVWVAWPRQVGGQRSGRLVRQGARVCGGHYQAGGSVRPPPA
jgi:hypothetical protein